MMVPGVVVHLALSAMVQPQGWEPVEPPRLAHQIGIDFKNVFTTKENLATVSVGLGAAWGASYLDEEIAQSTSNSELGESAAGEALEPGRILGGSAVQIGAAFATYGLGKLFHRPGVESLGRDLVRAQVVTQSLTLVLKTATQRERPDGSNQMSFPSGHSSGTFATATVLQRHYGWKVGVPAYAVAGYVAASRLNQNKHYLSDVVFGAAVGILVGRTVTLELGSSRFAVSPTLPPGGIGVQFTWVGQDSGIE